MPNPSGIATRSPSSLAALEARVRRELALIEAPLRQWVPERRDAAGTPLVDVVIVGAGLSGLSIAFGLMRQGITRVLVIDAAAKGYEGPWITSARMRTLRSPKTLSGPDLGVPALTYRAWYEANHGPEAWDRMGLIERADWMAYLCWFRGVTGIAVRNDTRLMRIGDGGNCLQLAVSYHGVSETIACRKVILATGIEGSGGLHVPKVIAETVPRERWTHSGEAVDIGHLKGQDIGVIGAAASSFDWAVAALEAGAKTVTLLARAERMPQTEILDWSNFPGFLNHFADLDDLRRYRFARRMFAFKTPPTLEMYERALAFPNCRLMLGAGIETLAMHGDRIDIATRAGRFSFDHLLLGTGYAVDLKRRCELTEFVGNIATWNDRFVPPEGEGDADLLGYPYLGPAFEFTEREPGLTPLLADIHIFNNGAVPSLGPVCNGITGLKSGVPKLVAGVSRGLFMADADLHYQSLDGYSKIHFDPRRP